MEGYSKLQVREIRRYARLIHEDEERATMEWIRRGLAKRFAIKHRERFGLVREAV